MDSPEETNLNVRFDISHKWFVRIGCAGLSFAIFYSVLKLASAFLNLGLDSNLILALRWLAVAGFASVAFLNFWRVYADLRLAFAALREIRKKNHPTPSTSDSALEFIGKLAGFLLPRKIRERCLEPFFEEMKADRLEEIAETSSSLVKGWINFCFCVRLTVAYLESLLCWTGDLLSKLSPVLRWIFKGGA